MPESGRIYIATNKDLRGVLDLSGANHRFVISYPLHDGDNQKVRFTELSITIVGLISISSWQWRFLKQNNGGWTIQNIGNGSYLDVDIPDLVGEGERVVAIRTERPREWTLKYDDQRDGWR